MQTHASPRPPSQVRYRFHIVITTYETVMQDPDPLTKIKWTYLIVDEGHKLKNRHSKLVEAMRELRARRRLVLTGTPLQNHVSELWSILNFLDPKKFDDLDGFLADYGALSAGTGTVEQVNKLNKLLKPHLLRREKADVEKSLHALKETLVYVEITNLQKLCYRACLEQNRMLLLHGVGAANAGAMSFNNVSMMLRHCCNHPWLIKEIEQSALSQLAAESSVRAPATLAEHNDPELWRATQARLEAQDEARYRDRLVQSSGKLVLLDKLLPKLKADGHRVLLFSQFTKMLDLIEDLVQASSWSSLCFPPPFPFLHAVVFF
jgi:chromodomain-helicase-DNA-binding protein 7